MLPRILTSFGLVGASTGFMFLGIGQAVSGDLDWMVNSGIVLMVVGLIAALIGGIMYRSTERAAEALIEHQNQLRGKHADGYKN